MKEDIRKTREEHRQNKLQTPKGGSGGRTSDDMAGIEGLVCR